MRAIQSVVLITCLGMSGSVSAAPDGAPARIQTLGSWRTHDPAQPDPGAEPWTPSDVAGFLAIYSNAFVDLGYRDGYPPGNRLWRDKGREANELQAALAQEAPDGRARICVTERPDILSKMDGDGGCDPGQGGGGCDWEGDMDGEFGEQERVVKHAGVASAGAERSIVDRTANWDAAIWQQRLLVLRPGRAAEERRRIVRSDATTLEVESAWTLPPSSGDRYEIRGSFDPRWVQRVPRSVHEATVSDLWESRRKVCGTPTAPRACKSPAEPLDPFHPANRRSWPSSRDRSAFAALATPSVVPALYGPVADAAATRASSSWTDPYFKVSAVVMDVADPSYRDWRIRYLMYKLRDHGLTPGEPACISLTYKPGWYTYYDQAAQGPSGDYCAVPGSGLWTGPAHVCRDGSAPGGPLVANLYGPDEYERAINSYIRELIARLAENGWNQLRIITTERPKYTPAVWAILDEDVRRHPAVIGEWMGPIEPALGELRRRPLPSPQPAAETPPPAEPPPLPIAPTPTVPRAAPPAAPTPMPLPPTAPTPAVPQAAPPPAKSTVRRPAPRPAAPPATHAVPQAASPPAGSTVRPAAPRPAAPPAAHAVPPAAPPPAATPAEPPVPPPPVVPTPSASPPRGVHRDDEPAVVWDGGWAARPRVNYKHERAHGQTDSKGVVNRFEQWHTDR